MQQIERYGVIALVFLLVTIVAVSFWGDSKSPGFWSRLTGRAAKKDAVAAQAVDPMIPAAPTGERAIQGDLPMSPAASTAAPTVALDPAPSTAAAQAPATSSAAVPMSTPTSTPATSPPVALRTQNPVQTAWTAPAAERHAEGSEYVVEKGDSLIGIASKMLGSKGRWTEIRDLNQGVDPRRLAVGTKLALPVSAPASRSAAPAKLQAPVHRSATAPATKGSGGTYLVHKGDTLKSIAARLLGNESRWREIAASNPGVDPHRIHVGSKLHVPAGKSVGTLAGKPAGNSEPQLASASIPARSASSTTPSSSSASRPRVR